jgi:hypothetical protein
MNDDAKVREDREFQFEIAKLQVDFEYSFSGLIGLLVILFGLLVLNRDNPGGYFFTFVMVVVVVVFLGLVRREKERRLREIRIIYHLFPT